MVKAYFKTDKLWQMISLKQLISHLLILFFLFFLIIGCSPSLDSINITSVADELASVITQSKSPIAPYTVRVDSTNPDNPRIIIDVINSSTSDGTFELTVPIYQDLGVTTNIDEFTVTASSQNSSETLDQGILTNYGSDTQVAFSIQIRISGVAIQEWLNADTFSNYIKLNFPSQTSANLMFSSDGTIGTLSINGLTNTADNRGTIEFNLPSGFEVDVEFITIDKTGTSFTINPTTFIITETANPSNSHPYTFGTSFITI